MSRDTPIIERRAVKQFWFAGEQGGYVIAENDRRIEAVTFDCGNRHETWLLVFDGDREVARANASTLEHIQWAD